MNFASYLDSPRASYHFHKAFMIDMQNFLYVKDFEKVNKFHSYIHQTPFTKGVKQNDILNKLYLP